MACQIITPVPSQSALPFRTQRSLQFGDETLPSGFADVRDLRRPHADELR